MPILEAKDLQKRFGERDILRAVSFSLNEGESLAIIGGSGVGKSVTLRCLLGLTEPDAGEIWLFGERQIGKRRAHKKIGMMFQGGALFDSLPVWQNVAFAALRDGEPQERARELARTSLNMVGLAESLMDAYPSSLSGGMHKRVGLARAIAPRPPLLFFDEPTTGLDPIMADVINHLIRDCVQELGASAITITHDMSSVRVFADKVGFLYQGELMWQGGAQALLTSDDAHLKQFVEGRERGPITDAL